MAPAPAPAPSAGGSAVEPAEPGLGVRGRALAFAAPAIDAAVSIGVVAVISRNHVGAAFGWTPQAPLVLSLVRVVWLGIVAGLASVERSCTRCDIAAKVLEVAFPYIASLALGALGIARIITDEPSGLDSVAGRGFWTLVVAGLVCVLLETYFTLEAMPLLRDRARERGEARGRRLRGEQPTERLDRQLLAADADGGGGLPSEAAAGAPPTPAAVAAAAQQERKKREKAEKEKKELEQRRPTVKHLLRLVAADWHLLILAAVLLVLAAISEVLIPKFSSEAIGQIIQAEERGTLATRPFKGPVIKLLITAACCGVFSAFRGATFLNIGARASMRLRQSLFDNLLRQEVGFYDETKTGELTSRMTQDCQKVADQVTLNVNVFLRTVVQTITTLAFMVSISTHLTGVAFVSVPCVVVLSKKYGGVMKELSRETQKSLADANAVAEEVLSTMATVRMFAAEGLASERFGARMNVFRKLLLRQARFYIIYLSCTIFMPQSVTALVLFYGGKLAMDGEIKAKNLLAFIMYLQTLNNNFSTLGDFYTNMVQALGAATRVFEYRSRQPELPLDPPETDAPAPPYPEGALKLEGLRFRYPARPDVEVLKGLSLEVPAGKVVALVGPSGNGKSTVISLLKRLYKAEEGRVLLDGVDVWDFKHEEFHQIVSIVGQEPVLYARSIRDNILYGLRNPIDDVSVVASRDLRLRSSFVQRARFEFDEHEVLEAARKANAHDFIMEFPQGYDNQVGERGVQLSGGQKQRIAIARALIRRPKVLLLDEATSALDAESERLVQGAVDQMITEGSMTVVIIAHRLSTVRNSHKICVITDGRVAEEGTHDDLVARRGAYFRLVECQLAGSSAEASALGDGPVAAATHGDESCAAPEAK